jgi:hypothetical protein
MSGRDNSQWSRPGAPPRRRRPAASGDVLEQGNGEPPRRPQQTAILLGAAGLILGLAVGYALGHAGRTAAPTPVAQASASPGSTATHHQGAQSPEDGPPLTGPDSLVQSGSQCATQSGHRLQLGVQVINQSAVPVTLRRVAAVEPPGGLRVATKAWGTCGELRTADRGPGRTVSPGDSTWFTVTFRVLVKCPGALPVKFTVGYLQHGEAYTAHLPGFVDLGHVPYAGCPVSG